jgi:hypothetical protein
VVANEEVYTFHVGIGALAEQNIYNSLWILYTARYHKRCPAAVILYRGLSVLANEARSGEATDLDIRVEAFQF